MVLRALRGVNHIAALGAQEEPIILTKHGLFHHPIDLDHFEQINDVHVPIKLLNPRVEVKIVLRALLGFQAALFAAPAASDEVVEGVAGIVAQLMLVEDRVEDVEELLALGLVTDQLRALVMQALHEILLKPAFLLHCCHVASSGLLIRCNSVRALEGGPGL